MVFKTKQNKKKAKQSLDAARQAHGALGRDAARQVAAAVLDHQAAGDQKARQEGGRVRGHVGRRARRQTRRMHTN